jgi:hypothetical protein
MGREAHQTRPQRLGASCDHLRGVALVNDEHALVTGFDPECRRGQGAEANGVVLAGSDADGVQVGSEAPCQGTGSRHRLQREL